MIRIALAAALFVILAGGLAAQQQDKQQDKQQGQQGQQNQQQSSQQQSSQDPDSDDAPVSTESSSKKPREETEKNGKAVEPDEPPPLSADAAKAKANARYDPFPAEQDVEVGMFYLHKGDVDAAIDRFLDAIQRRPNFAKPRLLLGKAYERKKDYESAVKYYKEYLQVLPGAPDAKDVQKKIEKLSAKAQ